jgi:hypothetical protein
MNLLRRLLRLLLGAPTPPPIPPKPSPPGPGSSPRLASPPVHVIEARPETEQREEHAPSEPQTADWDRDAEIGPTIRSVPVSATTAEPEAQAPPSQAALEPGFEPAL